MPESNPWLFAIVVAGAKQCPTAPGKKPSAPGDPRILRFYVARPEDARHFRTEDGKTGRIGAGLLSMLFPSDNAGGGRSKGGKEVFRLCFDEFPVVLSGDDAAEASEGGRLWGWTVRYSSPAPEAGGRSDVIGVGGPRGRAGWCAACALAREPLARTLAAVARTIRVASIAGGSALDAMGLFFASRVDVAPGRCLDTRRLASEGRLPASLPLWGDALASSDTQACPTGDVSLLPLLSRLDGPGLLLLWSALLLERRVLVVSRRMSVRGSGVLAALALLDPLRWQHAVLPVVPDAMLEVVLSPYPILAGVSPSQLARLARSPSAREALGPLVVVSLDDGYVCACNGSEPLPQAFGDAPSPDSRLLTQATVRAVLSGQTPDAPCVLPPKTAAEVAASLVGGDAYSAGTDMTFLRAAQEAALDIASTPRSRRDARQTGRTQDAWRGATRCATFRHARSRATAPAAAEARMHRGVAAASLTNGEMTRRLPSTSTSSTTPSTPTPSTPTPSTPSSSLTNAHTSGSILTLPYHDGGLAPLVVDLKALGLQTARRRPRSSALSPDAVRSAVESDPAIVHRAVPDKAASSSSARGWFSRAWTPSSTSSSSAASGSADKDEKEASECPAERLASEVAAVYDAFEATGEWDEARIRAALLVFAAAVLARAPATEEGELDRDAFALDSALTPRARLVVALAAHSQCLEEFARHDGKGGPHRAWEMALREMGMSGPGAGGRPIGFGSGGLVRAGGSEPVGGSARSVTRAMDKVAAYLRGVETQRRQASAAAVLALARLRGQAAARTSRGPTEAAEKDGRRPAPMAPTAVGEACPRAAFALAARALPLAAGVAHAQGVGPPDSPSVGAEESSRRIRALVFDATSHSAAPPQPLVELAPALALLTHSESAADAVIGALFHRLNESASADPANPTWLRGVRALALAIALLLHGSPAIVHARLLHWVPLLRFLLVPTRARSLLAGDAADALPAEPAGAEAAAHAAAAERKQTSAAQRAFSAVASLSRGGSVAQHPLERLPWGIAGAREALDSVSATDGDTILRTLAARLYFLLACPRHWVHERAFAAASGTARRPKPARSLPPGVTLAVGGRPPETDQGPSVPGHELPAAYPEVDNPKKHKKRPKLVFADQHVFRVERAAVASSFERLHLAARPPIKSTTPSKSSSPSTSPKQKKPHPTSKPPETEDGDLVDLLGIGTVAVPAPSASIDRSSSPQPDPTEDPLPEPTKTAEEEFLPTPGPEETDIALEESAEHDEWAADGDVADTFGEE